MPYLLMQTIQRQKVGYWNLFSGEAGLPKKSSQSEIMVVVKFPVLSSEIFWNSWLPLWNESQSLGCLLWRARVFCTTNDVTRFQTLVSCFSRYRPYFYPIKRNVPMLERSSFFATMMHNNSNLEIHEKKGGAFFRFMCTLKYKIGSTASVWRW